MFVVVFVDFVMVIVVYDSDLGDIDIDEYMDELFWVWILEKWGWCRLGFIMNFVLNWCVLIMRLVYDYLYIWLKLLMVYFIWYIYMDEIFIGVKVIIIVLKNFECIVLFYKICIMRKMCID